MLAAVKEGVELLAAYSGDYCGVAGVKKSRGICVRSLATCLRVAVRLLSWPGAWLCHGFDEAICGPPFVFTREGLEALPRSKHIRVGSAVIAVAPVSIQGGGDLGKAFAEQFEKRTPGSRGVWLIA